MARRGAENAGEGARRALWPARTATRFQAALLDWYRVHRRELPWREDPSPYRVWVSEIMLQQTQVRTVLPYFERFVRRFPDIGTLARAGIEEILEHWAGLGYYRRARDLHRAARIVADEKGGRFPDSMIEMRRLPGVGRYTAGAILSIAFNREHPVVDGNVRRVIRRLRALECDPGEDFFWRQAQAWIPPGSARDFNQAVMELGALVCTPARPGCASCPAAEVCAARRLGLQERIPEARAARAAEEVAIDLFVVEHRGAVLLTRDQPLACVPGVWGLPSASIGISVRDCGEVRHGITRHRITARVRHAAAAGRRPAAPAGCRWFPSEQAYGLLTSSLYRKALRAAGFGVPKAGRG